MTRLLLLAAFAATLAGCHGRADVGNPAFGSARPLPATGTVVVQPN